MPRAVRAGHTYVKVFGAGGPDLRLQAEVPGSTGPPAIMGDTIRAQRAEFTAGVIGGGPSLDLSSPRRTSSWWSRMDTGAGGAGVQDDFSLAFIGREPGRYRLQLQRGSAIEGITSPIYLEPSPGERSRPGAGDHPVPTAEPTASGPSPSGAGDERAAAPGGRADRRTPSGPDAGPESARAAEDQGTLPFTGAQLGMAGVVGTALVGIGLRLRPTLSRRCLPSSPTRRPGAGRATPPEASCC